jgi:CTP:molybdopterin cytidylyltransferase MocA
MVSAICRPDSPSLCSLSNRGVRVIVISILNSNVQLLWRSCECAVAEVDCGRITPSPEAIRTAVNDSLASSVGPSVASPSLIILDSAERRVGRGLAARRVLAGYARRFGGSHRQPQTARCCMALGSGLAGDASSDLAAQPVRHTHPYAASSRRDRCRPAVEGIDVDLLDQVMALTYGHPLATSLLIDVIRRAGAGAEVPRALADQPDLVAALLQRLVDLVPSSHQRAALQVSAHAQVTTEPVLCAALPSSDAAEVSELWDWLRGPTFMEEAHAGIRPHELARDVLQADLRWRDPDAYADIHRRLRGYLVDKIRTELAIRSACTWPQPSCSSFIMIIRW